MPVSIGNTWPWPPRPTSKKRPTFQRFAAPRFSEPYCAARSLPYSTSWSVTITTFSGSARESMPNESSARLTAGTMLSWIITMSGFG